MPEAMAIANGPENPNSPSRVSNQTSRDNPARTPKIQQSRTRPAQRMLLSELWHKVCMTVQARHPMTCAPHSRFVCNFTPTLQLREKGAPPLPAPALLDFIFTACQLASPQVCETVRMVPEEDYQMPSQCAMAAQPVIALYMRDHPTYFIKAYGCTRRGTKDI